MGLARQREQVADAHLKAANELVSYAQARVNAAQKAVDLANARLEQAKFKAVQASGDQAVNNIDGQAIAKRVEDARVALEQERAKVAQAKASATAARTSWVALRDQLPADQRFGVGGSGSDTAANLSGKTGTNQTTAGARELQDRHRQHRSPEGPDEQQPEQLQRQGAVQPACSGRRLEPAVCLAHRGGSSVFEDAPVREDDAIEVEREQPLEAPPGRRSVAVHRRGEAGSSPRAPAAPPRGGRAGWGGADCCRSSPPDPR